MYWSFTKLKTWRDCPIKYKNWYVTPDKTKEIKNNHLAMGNAMDHFLEFYTLNPNISEVTAKEYLVKKAKADKMLLDESMIPQFEDMVTAYIKSGLVLKPFIDSTNKPMIQRWFNINIKAEVYWKGKVDIITENKALVDWKTSKNKYNQKEVDDIYNSDAGMQMLAYCPAYIKWFGELPKKAGFQVITKDTLAVQNIPLTRKIEERDIHWLYNLIIKCDEEAKLAIKNDCFMPGENPKCYWCENRDVCGR